MLSSIEIATKAVLEQELQLLSLTPIEDQDDDFIAITCWIRSRINSIKAQEKK